MTKLASICLDPGHGGSQPGAVNPRLNLKEKDIALAVSQRVAEYLLYAYRDVVTGTFTINELCPEEHKPLLNVFMTRGDDVDVTLQERCAFANSISSACFVSIHCNSYSGTTANGIEIWMWKEGSKKSKFLAESVHQYLMESVKGFVITDQDGKSHAPKSRGVGKNQTYYTLRHTVMPSIVVEIGFISHDGEAKLMSTKEYQDAIARGIALGILYSTAV